MFHGATFGPPPPHWSELVSQFIARIRGWTFVHLLFLPPLDWSAQRVPKRLLDLP